MYSLPSLNCSLKALKIDLQRPKHKLYVLLDLIYGLMKTLDFFNSFAFDGELRGALDFSDLHVVV